LRTLCRKEDKHWCPYYLSRHMLAFANVIVYNYQYMLDPKARRLTSCLCLHPDAVKLGDEFEQRLAQQHTGTSSPHLTLPAATL